MHLHHDCRLLLIAGVVASFTSAIAENICNETPPDNRYVDGIPAYAQCDESMDGPIYSNNGIDTRTTSGGSEWIRTQYSGGYQCTEFAHRYLYFVWNVAGVPGGNAGSWCENRLPSGLEKTTTPVHGDLIVFAPGVCGAGATTGHVAVVDSVNDTAYITIVEQNRSSRRRCKISCAECFLHASTNGGIVATRTASPGTHVAASGIAVLPFSGGVELRLSGYFSTEASIRLFQLDGKLVADLSNHLSDGRVLFKTPHVPASLVVQVTKKGQSISRMILTTQ